jgi:rubrerythrin
MSTVRLVRVLTLAAATTLPAATAVFAGDTAPMTPATAVVLEHLQDAFNGESNAKARYEAFAKKAESDGYAPVASLFRAAARAEGIHAANHAVVIRKLGAEPTATLKAPEVRATVDNLKAAVEGETYERDKMYPQFIKDARAAGDADAVRTFNFALSAEGEHARLYAQASDRLPSLKGVKAETYYVCTVCGFTTTQLDFNKCPACASPKEKYVTVS